MNVSVFNQISVLNQNMANEYREHPWHPLDMLYGYTYRRQSTLALHFQKSNQFHHSTKVFTNGNGVKRRGRMISISKRKSTSRSNDRCMD